MDARAACLALGMAAGAAATYAYYRPILSRVISERDELRTAGEKRDAAAMDRVSQLLQRGARATARAKQLVASKSRSDIETEEQRMRRTMPTLSPMKRARPKNRVSEIEVGGAAADSEVPPPSLPRPLASPNTLCLFMNRACPFAHRAFIVALEKQLDAQLKGVHFQTVHIDTDPDAQPRWWQEVSPTGNLPALQHVGGNKDDVFLLAGSVECCEWLDQNMPSPVDALLPEEDELALEIGSVVQLFARKFVGPGFRLLTNRHPLRDQDLGRGFEEACSWWDRLLGSKNAGKGGAFYFGSRFSMVEAMTFPFADRFAAVLPVYRGFSFDQEIVGRSSRGDNLNTKHDRWPALMAWISACRRRPSVARSRATDEFYVECYEDAAGARVRAWDQGVRGTVLFAEQDNGGGDTADGGGGA